MRKLASIQIINDIKPIENTDSIEVARVLGWLVVVKKDEFKIGDKVIYVEIDSVLPEKPEFEFMRNKKFKVKTIKLRGQISQGICFPLSILPESEYNEDDDVTELLNIVKYEKPIPAQLQGQAKGNFPSFVPKTDETRVQVLQKLLSKYKDTKCYITEKLDGCSATYYLKDGEFGVCSRNIDLKDTEGNTYWEIAKKYDIENKLRKMNKNIAIQGEIIGDGIQGNKYKLKQGERKFYMFNIFDIDEYKYLSCLNYYKLLELDVVPVVDDNFQLIDDIDLLVKISEGKSIINDKTNREGLVIRPQEETEDIRLGRLSFKVINLMFLLKHNE